MSFQPKKFVSVPKYCEAVQWDGKSFIEMQRWVDERIRFSCDSAGQFSIAGETISGRPIPPGHWVAKGGSPTTIFSFPEFEEFWSPLSEVEPQGASAQPEQEEPAHATAPTELGKRIDLASINITPAEIAPIEFEYQHLMLFEIDSRTRGWELQYVDENGAIFRRRVIL